MSQYGDTGADDLAVHKTTMEQRSQRAATPDSQPGTRPHRIAGTKATETDGNHPRKGEDALNPLAHDLAQAPGGHGDRPANLA
jgi:hypothetical protein